MSSNILEQRSFGGGLNTDDKNTSVADNQYINASNLRFGNATEAGKALQMQSVPGTTLLANSLSTTGLNYNAGTCSDDARLRVYYFTYNTLGFHRIDMWDAPSLTAYTVLLSSQVNGGLNFGDLNYIHSCYVLNGCLYWTDNLNELKRIDIEACLKMNQPTYVTTVLPYTAPLDISVQTIIRRQPGLPPVQQKLTQTVPPLVNNFIAQEPTQFCYRYVYRNFEIGTLSGLSTLANSNQDTDTFNSVLVTIPLQEVIQQDVIQIDLVVRYLISGIYFIVKSWKTTVPADAAAIAAHNSATTALSYTFLNDRIGIALDSAYSVKPFDSVPNLAQTIAAARDRTFAGNYYIGYDTPITTSLTAAPQLNTTSGSLQGGWWLLKFSSQFTSNGIPSGPITTTTIYLIDISNIPANNNPGYYFYVPGGVPPFPASVNYAQCSFYGVSPFAVMSHISPGTVNTILSMQFQNVLSNVTNGPSSPQLIGKTAFKSDATYQLSVNFRDYWGRECGVVLTDAARVYVQDVTYANTTYTTSIQWTLSNANAVNEIPSWAYYFSVNMTKCLRTRFFQQIRSLNIIYATKDANNNYLYNTNAYATTNAGVAIDITNLLAYAQGYVFNPGDIVKVYSSNTPTSAPTSLSIIGQDGKYIICQNTNLGTLNQGVPTEVLIEIYTPYQQQANEANYEVGQIFPINNPGTVNAAYSTIQGKIFGDVTLLNRNDGTNNYITEAMSPTDKLYQLWETDSGRPNFIDTIGKVHRTNSVAYSNTVVTGTKINGLSTFDALDTVDVPSENGAIKKLQLASKVEKLGSIMLAICKTECVSMYLSEQVVAAPQGTAFIASSGNVIGTIYPLKGSFGTNNPESVAEYRGDVFWVDVINGVVVQYSSNGLDVISKFNLKHFWRKWSIQYNSLTSAQIEAFGSRPFIQGGIDPFNLEYLISLPQVEATNPAGFLPGFSTNAPQNLFDIYDGQSKTMVYNIEKNTWMPTLSFYSEGLQNSANQLYGLSKGALYRHNDVNARYNNFYGVDYISRIMFPSSQDSTDVKIYNSISIESDIEPTYGVMYITYPNVQCTDWDATTTENREGAFVASIYRDRNSPAYVPNYDQAWAFGDKMRSRSAVIEVDFAYNQVFNLRYVNINYIKSSGHRVKAQSRQEHQG